MQAYFLTRGHYDQVNRFINDLLAQRYERESLKVGKYKVGWQVRPIQLWESATVKEDSDRMLAAIGPSNLNGVPSSFLWAFRKALDLKPINKVFPPTFCINKDNVQVCWIGYREDEANEEGVEII